MISPKPVHFFLMLLVATGLFLGKVYWAPAARLTQSTPAPIPQAVSIPTEDWLTYTTKDQQLSFKYPADFFYIEHRNGVVLFFKTEAQRDACQNNPQALEDNPCFKANFNFNGQQIFPSSAEYETYLKEQIGIANPLTVTDGLNRTWQTDMVLGQVYNFSAATELSEKVIRLSFQSGFNSEDEPEVSFESRYRRFFEAVLGTVTFNK